MKIFKKILGYFNLNKRVPPEGFESIEIKEMEFKQGRTTLALAHPTLGIFAGEVAKFFKDTGSVNYVSTVFWHPDLGEMEMIVQLREKKTPSQLHQELLMAVESKFPGESRHETAMRYIKNAENRVSETGSKKSR